MIRVLSLCLISLSLLACDSSSDSSDEFEGSYTVEVASRTESGNDGGTCTDASGSFEVDDNAIIGTALSEGGFMFDITGSISSDGEVTGGFAVSDQIAASFTGNFMDATASGTWEESTGCSGTWQAAKST